MAYANQVEQNSESIWDKTKDWNNADSFDLGVSLKRNNIDLNLSNKYSNAMSHFIIIFIASVIKYNVRDVKN